MTNSVEPALIMMLCHLIAHKTSPDNVHCQTRREDYHNGEKFAILTCKGIPNHSGVTQGSHLTLTMRATRPLLVVHK